MKFKKMFLLLLCCGVFIVPGKSCPEAKKKSVFRFKDQVVVLEGKMTTRLEFGAPGFGEDPEHDQKENIFILIPDNPIDVIGDPDDPGQLNTDNFFKVKALQMDIPIKMVKRYRKFLGKKVKVTGSLFQGHTGHHHTDVLIDVSAIELLKKEKK